MNESSDVRQKFKNFTKEFREHERLGSPANGYQDARNFATQCLSGAGPMILPKHAHWRIYMVLADLSKRENSLGKVKFQIVELFFVNTQYYFLNY